MSQSDTESLSEFVSELTNHQQALRCFVSFLLNGAEGVSDTVQEINSVLWEKRKRFQPGTNFRAWAFTTARYVVLSQRRKMKRDHAMIFDADLLETLADEWQAEPDEHEKKLVMLESCLKKLPDEDRELVMARYSSHGAVENMAEEFGKSAGSLRQRLFRLRAALKKCVHKGLLANG